MAFGKKNTRQRDETQSTEWEQSQNQASNEDFIDLEVETQPLENTSEENHSQIHKKPLLDEVTMVEAQKGKNAGGTKRWKCNHYKKSYSSSYTRIHHHFFGAPVGVKAEIARYTVILTNRTLLRQLKKKVEEAEKTGISPSLTRSTVNNKLTGISNNPIEKAFGAIERHDVDIGIVRFLCANGIPSNVLRSPEMALMTNAIKNAPKDYKHPSADRARTSLLDDCKRVIEKECVPISDTWTMQGTSIISDGWTNIKKKSLINVFASNSRGSMFLYAEDFSDVEKTRKEISNFLLKAIDEVGSSNHLQVITDNAANCKAAGKEIEKDWLNSGDERTKELGREVTTAIKDEVFWDEIDNILAITKPIYRMIKFADGEG
ncbi:hypothetical protein AgCh_001280 [Apium graveolens]